MRDCCLLELTLKFLRKGLKEVSAGKTSQTLATQLNKAGESYTLLKEYDKALSYFEQNARLLDGKEPESIAEIYKEMANVHLARGDRTRAISYFRKSYVLLISMAPKLAADSPLESNLIDVLISLVMLYQLEGQEAAAAELIRDATAQVNNDEFRGFLAFFYGMNKWMRGEVASAVADNEEAFRLLSKVGGDTGERNEVLFSMSFLLSIMYSGQGDYRHAAENLRRARKHFVAIDEEGEVIPEDLIKMVEGLFYGAQGVENVALSRMESFFSQVFRNVTGEVSVSDLLALKGMDYLRRGEGELGLQCLLKGLEFAAEVDDRILIARLHNYVAGYYSSRNEYPKALEHYQASLTFSQGTGPLYIIFSNNMMAYSDLMGIANIQTAQEKYDEAIATYKSILSDNQIFSLYSAHIYQEMAEAYYAQHKYKEALAQLQKGIDVSLRTGNRVDLWELYQLSGRLHWALGEYSLAQSSEYEAINEIERTRRDVVGGELVLERFFEDKLSPYHDMITLLIDRKDIDGALAYAERAKSRVLLDALKHGRKYARKFMSQTEQQSEKTLRMGLISLNRRISEARQNDQQVDALRALRATARLDYEVFKANLYVNHAALLPEQPEEKFGLSSLSQILPEEDAALLEFVVTDANSYLFVITTNPDSREPTAQRAEPLLQVYPLGIGSDDLADKVNYFRLRVTNPDGPIEIPAHELYDLLIKPAEQQLMGKKTLIIVPDGSLWELPFQALKPTNDRFLVDDRAISYAPSLAALQEMRKLRNQRSGQSIKGRRVGGGRPSSRESTLLAVGNPARFEKSQELPGTQALAKKLQTLYGKGQAHILVGVNADEERIKKEAEYYQVVHIGAHGVLDNVSPMYSYLMLAQTIRSLGGGSGSEEKHGKVMNLEKDGLLEAWELMDLELNSQLVVLSACETARGRVSNGEGIVGMTWALFMAGSPATAVSQWRVESDSTNELMFLFHKNLVIGKRLGMKIGPAGALQRAAIKLKESGRYRHPYYWAGFVLMGDGGR